MLFDSSPSENAVLPALCARTPCWDFLIFLHLQVFAKPVKWHCCDSEWIQPAFLIDVHLS